jgi:hypothetical protein
MTDFVSPIMQAALAGFTLKVGRVSALLDPPIVKSEEPEGVDTSRVGELGQISRTVTVIGASEEVRGVPPAPALAVSEITPFRIKE